MKSLKFVLTVKKSYIDIFSYLLRKNQSSINYVKMAIININMNYVEIAVTFAILVLKLQYFNLKSN